MNELLTREERTLVFADQAESEPSLAEPLFGPRTQAQGHGGFRLHFPIGFDNFDF